MKVIVAVFTILILTAISSGCKKENTGAESDLYDTWIRGSNFGDALWFMKKKGRYVVRMPESSNPAMSLYTEKEYRLKDGVLCIGTVLHGQIPVKNSRYKMCSCSYTCLPS